MNNYWCEICDNRWQEEFATECPNCHEKFEFRRTMSKEEAFEKRLIDTNLQTDEEVV